jgi:hypothetical protein
MEDSHQAKDDVDEDILPALKEYITRVFVAAINSDVLDNSLITLAVEKQDATDILTKFIISAESSIVFLEDATSEGGEGAAHIIVTFFSLDTRSTFYDS